jgi:peptide chain release factor subunit 1
MKNQMLTSFQQSLSGKSCPKCKAPALGVAETQDLIDNFAQLAEYTNADVEMISGETEEGQMLKNSFGGIAAILRFKLGQ